MTLPLALSPSVKQARSAAVAQKIDAAATPGRIELYPAPRPASGAAPEGSLLATLVFTDPCGTVDEAGLHLTSGTPAQAEAAGIVDWARVTDGDGNWLMDGDVRQVDAPDAAGAAFIIDVAQLYPGSFVNLVSATLAEGG